MSGDDDESVESIDVQGLETQEISLPNEIPETQQVAVLREIPETQMSGSVAFYTTNDESDGILEYQTLETQEISLPNECPETQGVSTPTTPDMQLLQGDESTYSDIEIPEKPQRVINASVGGNVVVDKNGDQDLLAPDENSVVAETVFEVQLEDDVSLDELSVGESFSFEPESQAIILDDDDEDDDYIPSEDDNIV